MGKTKRGVRDGTGPYHEMGYKMRRAMSVCPFDKESVEDIKNMKIKIDIEKDIKIVSDKIGKGSLALPVHLLDERRFIK